MSNIRGVFSETVSYLKVLSYKLASDTYREISIRNALILFTDLSLCYNCKKLLQHEHTQSHSTQIQHHQ